MSRRRSGDGRPHGETAPGAGRASAAPHSQPMSRGAATTETSGWFHISLAFMECRPSARRSVARRRSRRRRRKRGWLRHRSRALDARSTSLTASKAGIEPIANDALAFARLFDGGASSGLAGLRGLEAPERGHDLDVDAARARRRPRRRARDRARLAAREPRAVRRRRSRKSSAARRRRSTPRRGR